MLDLHLEASVGYGWGFRRLQVYPSAIQQGEA
jgi:hypothetical protein